VTMFFVGVGVGVGVESGESEEIRTNVCNSI
jgi:hypothetical protein